MQKEPPPYVWAVPDERNILTCALLNGPMQRGPPDSPYAGGEYHGQLLFPAEYPFKPPGIKMLTPSGRFYPDKKICFSMSDFHPGSVRDRRLVVLTGLLSFMLSDEITTGSVNSSPAHKRGFAAQSHNWNIQQARFREAFPEYATPEMRDLPNMGEKERGRADKPPTPPPAPSQSASSTAAQAAPSAPGHPANAAQPANGAQPAPAPGAWGAALWEKWRWGVLIVLAVLLSRMSGQ
ncbi:UBC-like protein [Schizophyllum commune]